jgi:mono/diheme cytochrome c family protein
MRPFPRSTFLALLLAASAVSLTAAERAPDGRKIFAQKCAACHGAKGQGVKDKYADPLVGDWSIAKLARYVAANMPEDKPETLSPAEAEAVARYLHGAFYSREAQARLHPSRVELAHLTNRQYLTTIADLLRGFVPADPPVGGEPGLRSSFYATAPRGRFETAELVHTSIDRELDFDLARGIAPGERLNVAPFSMQWRGSLLADETGDYEFNLRTTNSVRAWINAEPDRANASEAVIDANVSTPENPDHRVTIRLIGGRRYPLAIDYWALPGKVGSPPAAFALRWKPPHGTERNIPARNLSTAMVQPTFVIATPFPADDSSLGYERAGAVSKAWDEATTSAAFEVANHLAKKIDRYTASKPTDEDRAKKIEAFAGDFVAAAFRRPLTAAEKKRYVTDRFKSTPDAATALTRVVLLALKAPQFLYVELPAGKPDPARVASRLSFGLWDSLPDPALTQAAATGGLRTRGEVNAQANRMLADPRAAAKLRGFFHHWLQMRFVEDLRKDPALYPDFTPDVIDDLRTSLNLFLDEVVWSERSDFRELLRADYLVANDRLAKFYGLPAPAADGFARVEAGTGERAGVLTHPYLLAALSYKTTTSPIHRGVFLTRNIVGRALKSPPVAQTFDEAEFAPGMTMREKVAKLTRSENCQGCHAVINPLGFSLEWFDAVGRFRREENGRAIDAVGEYVTDDSLTVRLAGPRDLAEFAIGSERANNAFIEQLFHHMVKQPIMAYGPGALDRLRESFIASGYNLQKLMVEIVTVSAVHGLEPPIAAFTPTRKTP